MCGVYGSEAQRWGSMRPAVGGGCGWMFGALRDTTGGVHGVGALVSHSHNFA